MHCELEFLHIPKLIRPQRRFIMKLALKNRLFAFISLSRIFNILGSSIYNIVFIVFASSMPQPKFAVGIANFIVLVPTFFTVFVGMKADKTHQKARWLIHLGYLQAFLFILVALLTKSASYLAFATVCFLNIFSDIISDYRSGLQMPILQKNIEEKDLMEAYSFTQLLTFLGNFAGQALGVWLLSISQQNFAMVALINALCFLLSSSTLYLIRQKLTHDAPAVAEQKLPFKAQMKDLYQNVQMIFEQEKIGNFLLVLLQVLLLNALAGSIMGLYNLYLLDHPFWGLNLSQSLLVIESCTVIGIISASAFSNDYFSKLSLMRLVVWCSLALLLLGLSNLLQAPALLGIFFLTFLMYISGKINPKINSMLLSKLPAEVLAQTSNFLTMLFTFSIPLGSMLFTSLGLWNMGSAWLVFSLLSGVCLLLSLKNN